MMVLDFGRFHDRAEGTRATIRRRPLEIRVARLDVRPEERGGPVSLLEIFQSGVDVVREVALRGA